MIDGNPCGLDPATFALLDLPEFLRCGPRSRVSMDAAATSAKNWASIAAMLTTKGEHRRAEKARANADEARALASRLTQELLS